MATVKYKPWYKVSSQCAPKRVKDTLRWTGTWKVPSALTNSDSEYHATGIKVWWELGLGRNKNPYWVWTGGTGYTQSTFGPGAGWSMGEWESRYNYYPWKPANKLWNIHLWVAGVNGKGTGPWTHTYRAIGVPPKPTISAPVQNENTGLVTATVTQDRAGSGNNPCQRTDWQVWVKNTIVSEAWECVQSGESEQSTINLSYDASSRMELNYDQYIQIKFKARAHGLNGSTAWVERNLTVSYPSKAVINGIDAPSRNPSEKVTVHIDTRSSGEHFVTGCELEKLVNTEYKTADEIPADASWQTTNAVDNAKASALAVSVADLVPRPGNTSWVRVKTYNQIESLFYRYSEPARVEGLEVPAPSAGDDAIQLLQLLPDADGQSAIALMGWNADGTDDADGTELTWSSNENAWRSTSAPSKYEFSWSDGELEWTDASTSTTTTFADSARVHIEGLNEGSRYYVRARRYKTVDNETTYSDYSDTLSVTASYTPPSVKLLAPSFIPRGSSLALSWVFSSEAQQTSWQILKGDITSTVETIQGETVVTETFTETEIVDAGDDALGSCVLDASRLASLVGDDESVSLAVRVATGGAYIQSDGITVTLADAPVVTVTDFAQVTSQGFDVSIGCTTQSDISAVIVAGGASGEYPDGTHTQVAGDSVFSDVFDPDWTASASGYSASIAIPGGLDMLDGAQYTIEVAASDPNTGLSSEPVSVTFDANWSHKAPVPASGISLTPHDEEDADGFRRRYVEIQLSTPQYAANGDTYEVYRLTPDGSYMIASGEAQDALVTDMFAPYGSGQLAYRIAVRTVDNDVNWTDFPYTLAGGELRVDFGSQYVELPWNLTVGDAFSKDFEARAHLGSSAPEGYWNETVRRNASFSTDVLQLEERDQVERLRSLARYDGPVFVRVPNGCAFQANVEVSGLDEAYNSGFVAVALDGEEIGLTDQYMSLTPDRTQEDDPDELG